ncbi:hypothetical protein Clacol_000168 [Clathrus columnatus]|uniref:RING-type domain-containing protein n=1 Tax=Clathrus columnatus TaxID=1419009 RepID=A0AAV4ZZ17_9AGAM|nr:hypothetical protein Clacol_000168 [Clathrus columnatus]
MLSAYLSTLKRNFYAIIEENTSMHEVAACAAGHEEEETSPPESVKEEETVEELEARVKELEETIARDIKVAEQIASKLKKLKEEVLECTVCRDMIENPQLLSCGHSACYRCLRNWWTRLPAQYGGAEMIDTEAEDDTDEDPIVGDERNPDAEEITPKSHPRRRHIFPSAVNREKVCPCCNQVVNYRPVPDFQLCDIVETLNKDLAPLPSHIQVRKDARLTRRSDLWHGIFHPENQQGQPMLILPALLEPLPAPPPRHPDPILNHFAQEQYRRVVEDAVARQETVRARAYEDGRMRGILETRARRDRAEARQAAVMDHQIQEHGFAPANPLVVPREALGRDVPNVVQLRQDIPPNLPVVDILPPPVEDPAPV